LNGCDIIFRYFPDLTEKQKGQFMALQELYETWNSRINVISRKDMENLYVNHVLHSLGIARVINFLPKAKILDAGTGGGFPGIPLAILFPETRFHLVDSIAKKITVVKEVSSALRLQNVQAEARRVETLAPGYDFIVSRAVTRMKEFHGWVKHLTVRENRHSMANGILYLKGGDLSEELAEVKKEFRLYNLSDYFEESFFETKMVVYLPLN
jgi:16S rRNA (guanine527-N7)-methyltransferase